MATAKKTTKPAARSPKKPAPIVKPRVDYKAGARVKVQRKHDVVKGFVTGVKRTLTGAFIAVNIGSKKEPVVIEARPVKVRGF